MGPAPKCKAIGNRRWKKPTALKDVNVRTPANAPIQALGSEPVVITRRDENRDGICLFKLGTKKLARIWRYSLVLEQVAPTADHVNVLVDSELYAAGQCVAECLPSMAS